MNLPVNFGLTSFYTGWQQTDISQSTPLVIVSKALIPFSTEYYPECDSTHDHFASGCLRICSPLVPFSDIWSV